MEPSYIYPDRNFKDPRITVDEASIRYFRFESMSNRRRSGGRC